MLITFLYAAASFYMLQPLGAAPQLLYTEDHFLQGGLPDELDR
jgi:hypothetical protein